MKANPKIKAPIRTPVRKAAKAEPAGQDEAEPAGQDAYPEVSALPVVSRGRALGVRTRIRRWRLPNQVTGTEPEVCLLTPDVVMPRILGCEGLIRGSAVGRGQIQRVDQYKLLAKLTTVKANPKIKATKRTPVRKAAKTRQGRKSSRQGGFAPELCGIVTGPTDLSLREGFGRG